MAWGSGSGITGEVDSYRFDEGSDVTGDSSLFRTLYGADPAEGTSHAMAARSARRQRYGKWGSPWGDVPPALEDHLRRRTGHNAQAIRMRAGVDKVPEGMEIPDTYLGNPDASIELVEESPGTWIWTGWEDDPQYKAWKEQQASQRQSVARSRTAQQAPQPIGPMTIGTGGYGQLEQLYAAQELPAQRDTAQNEY